VAEKAPDFGHREPPFNFVKVCFEKETVLALFDACPVMLAALDEHVNVVVPNLTVAVNPSGLDLLRPLTVTGLPLESLTVET
jgi:hypothetical protein